MPFSLFPTLIIAITALLLGIVAGLLLGSLRGNSEEDVRPQPDSPVGSQIGSYQSILRLWREDSSQRLIVEMGDTSYVSSEGLPVDQRESLEKSAGELLGWLGSGVAGNIVPSVDRVVVERVVAVLPKPIETPPAPAELVLTTKTASPGLSIESQRQASPAPVLPVATVQKGMAAAVKEEPKSIVGQIDTILQEMLARSGKENRGISLTEDIRKGVIVWIGLDHYDGIDAVSDAEIKGMIRAAVNEWEHRQEQKLRY